MHSLLPWKSLGKGVRIRHSDAKPIVVIAEAGGARNKSLFCFHLKQPGCFYLPGP